MLRNFSDFKAIWEHIDLAYAGRVEAVAAGAGDNAEVNGLWLDRKAAGGDMYQSVAVFFVTSSAIADSQTLSITANFQDAVDGSGTGAADWGPALAKTAILAAAPGVSAEEPKIAKIGADLTEARRFIRVQFTPDLSAGSTDTTDIMVVVVWGGGKALTPLGTTLAR